MSKAKWSILVYIAAHNNLQQFGQISLQQIRDVGSTDDVKLAALYDAGSGARRYVVGAPGQVSAQETLGRFDSGDSPGLIDTAQWAFKQSPAEHYGLVLWSHGTGWQPEELQKVAQQTRGDRAVGEQEAQERSARSGSTALFRSTLAEILKQNTPSERAVLFDDGSQHSLDTVELQNVLHKLREFTGQPIDLLGMDACLMSSLEVAYQVRDDARYMVASEELVPAQSWPYDAIFGQLRANPDMAAGDLAKLIVADYYDFYQKNPPVLGGGDVTKAAYDLSRVGALSSALKQLSSALLADIARQRQAIWTAQATTRKAETKNGARKLTKFDFHLWDLGSFARELAKATRNDAVRAAAQGVSDALRDSGAILAEKHLGAWFDGTAGVSLYLAAPKITPRISPYYGMVALANDAQWKELLEKYNQTS